MKKLNQKGFGHIEAVIAVLLVIGIIAAGIYTYHESKTKTPATTNTSTTKMTAAQVINEFNLAMQKGDAAKVLSLESPWLQNYTKTQAIAARKYLPNLPISDNYYTDCKAEGLVCTFDWTAKNLADSKITTSSYKAANGTIGVKETFTNTSTTVTSTPASTTTSSTASSTSTFSEGSSTATGSSTTTFSVDAVPSGNTWLIDNLGSASDSVNVSL